MSTPPISERLVNALSSARYIAALTGAGVSAESGVPTFRDAQTGLWARFDPLELATPEAFARNPRLVWDWYAMRRDNVGRAKPNAAHRALATIESHAPQFLLATQNVDGLHERAGSVNVVELHGNITRVKCSREGTVATKWDALAESTPPRCQACGAFLRPDVVWFDEALPAEALERAEAAARACDVMLVIGTSAEVYPAAALPHYAQRAGAIVVEINPEVTALTERADYALRGKAGALLQALVAATWPAPATRG